MDHAALANMAVEMWFTGCGLQDHLRSINQSMDFLQHQAMAAFVYAEEEFRERVTTLERVLFFLNRVPIHE